MEGAGYEKPQKQQKRILGLRLAVFWLLAVLLVIIIVVAVAVPVAVTQNRKSSKNASAAAAELSGSSATTGLLSGSSTSQVATATAISSSSSSSSSAATSSTPVFFSIKPSSTSTSSASSSSTTSSSTTATPTAIQIISANYGGQDTTFQAKSAFIKGNSAVVNTEPFPLEDNWVGTLKCLSLLHNFGASIRTFVACEGEGQSTLAPGKVSLSPKTQEITRQGPTSNDFAIVSVVWGAKEIRTRKVYQTLYDLHKNGSAVTLSNDLFGEDTLVNWVKSAVIWYTEDNFSSFKTLSGRESDTVKF